MPAGAAAGWLSRLVRIPSVNPQQAGPRAGEPGEGAIGDAVAAWFADLGGDVVRHEVLPGRSNIYGRWKGEEEDWAALDVHVDTVGVEQMTSDPFSGEVRDGRVWGRGAVDTKASLAVALSLLEEMRLKGLRPRPHLLVAATVDEEVTAMGAPAFAAWVREHGPPLDRLMVAEPTRCGPVIAHRGGLRLRLHVQGIPAHSAQPHLGRNAITAAAAIVRALQEEGERLTHLPPSPYLATAHLTVTRIQGGTGDNVVPDRCTLTVDRRTLPGEEEGPLHVRLAALAADACPLPVETEVAKSFPAFFQDPSTPWVRELAELSGREPSGVPYGTNAWAYGGLARETVVLGPGSIDQAHGTEEWVELAELEKLEGIYRRWWGLDQRPRPGSRKPC